jgi:hypothetical protein
LGKQINNLCAGVAEFSSSGSTTIRVEVLALILLLHNYQVACNVVEEYMDIDAYYEAAGIMMVVLVLIAILLIVPVTKGKK